MPRANTPTEYERLTPTMMVELAAPHTWAASIVPVFIAFALALVHGGPYGLGVDLVMVCVLLAIAVLMQSAVNTINDYFDYVKGTDTVDNQPDPTDAVLVYNNVNPADVKKFALTLVGAAFVLGIYCIVVAGFVPLVIALVGVAVIYLYSGGKTPLSYLPVGEVVSGFVMGGLITVAGYVCLTLRFEPLVFVWALPVMMGIALIMFTNNGCDIDKDVAAGRKTLPVLLGYTRMLTSYHGLVYAWVAAIVVIIGIWFTPGLVVVLFMLLVVHPLGRALLANPLKPHTRPQAFAQCTSLNIALGAFYGAAILAAGLLG